MVIKPLGIIGSTSFVLDRVCPIKSGEPSHAPKPGLRGFNKLEHQLNRLGDVGRYLATESTGGRMAEHNNNELESAMAALQGYDAARLAADMFPGDSVLVFRIRSDVQYAALNMAVAEIRDSILSFDRGLLPENTWAVPYLNGQEWDSESLLFNFNEAELRLKKCHQISDQVGCLIFKQLGVPSGLECTMALIEAFGHEIIADATS